MWKNLERCDASGAGTSNRRGRHRGVLRYCGVPPQPLAPALRTTVVAIVPLGHISSKYVRSRNVLVQENRKITAAGPSEKARALNEKRGPGARHARDYCCTVFQWRSKLRIAFLNPSTNYRKTYPTQQFRVVYRSERSSIPTLKDLYI